VKHRDLIDNVIEHTEKVLVRSAHDQQVSSKVRMQDELCTDLYSELKVSEDEEIVCVQQK
jgi:hypothetical protein